MGNEEVAMEFAADVESAVASIRDLAATAQDLAATAKEASDGVEGIAAPAAGAAESVQGVTDVVTEADAALAAYSDEVRSAAGSAGDLAAAQASLKAAAAETRAAVAELGSVQAEAGKESQEYAAALDAAAAAMQRQAEAAGQLKGVQEEQAAAAAQAQAAAQGAATAQEAGAGAADTAAASTAAAGDAAAASAAKTDAAGASAAGMGSKMKMAGLAVAVGIGVATEEAAKFQAETTRLVTSAGESAANLGKVRQGMLAVSAQTDTSTEQMASGMYTIESAGFHGAQGLTVLKAAAQGAKDEGAELSTVSNAVTDALVDFHQPASQAANVTSQLIAAVSHGKTTFEEFSGSMSNVLPLASAMHLSLADVSGVLAEMTAHGVSAQQASQDEANAMRELMKPNAAMVKEFTALGITSDEVYKKLGSAGLGGTMQWLSGVAQQGAGRIGQNYTEALGKLMGTAPGLQVALMTTGENAKSTNAAIKGIASASADAKGNVDGFSTVSQTASFRLGAAAQSAKAAGISLGEVFVPAVTDALGPVTSFLQLVASNRAASIAFAVVVGGILATAVGVKLAGALKDAKEGVQLVGEGIGWLAGKLGLATAATDAQTAATEAATVAQTELDVAEDANPIGLIILAVAALIAIIVLLVMHWKTVWHDICAVVDWAVGFIRGHWQLLAGILLGPVVFVVAELATHWRQVEHDVMAVVNAVVNFIAGHWKEIVAWLVDPVGMAVMEIRQHWQEIEHVFDEGRHEVAVILDGARHDIAAAWDGIRHDVAATADAIPGDVVKAWDTVTRDTQRAWDELVRDVESAFDDLRRDTETGVADVVSWFEKLPGEVEHELEQLPGDMLTIGRNVIDGLIHGIESAAADIPSLMSGLASSVESYFTDPLKIFSPSLAFYSHGWNVVQGAINGVKANAPNLLASMRDLAGGVNGTGSAMAATAAAPGGQQHTFNVNMQAVPAGSAYDTPEFQQYMQQQVQEAVLRYGQVNVSNGLTPAWGQ